MDCNNNVIIFKESEESDEQNISWTENNTEYDNIFRTAHLLKLINLTNISLFLKIYFKKDYPLVISCKVASLGISNFIIKPHKSILNLL